MGKKEGWYSKKNYSHFDLPMPFLIAKGYVSNIKNVIKHSFLPFLSFEKKVRRFRKCPITKQTIIDSKIRPIKFASHKDSYIFSYYSRLIQERYEAVLKDLDIGDCILAYRSGLGSNINFAMKAFQAIKARSSCAAIGMDISGFFDNLDHEQLWQQWCYVLGVEKLPKDHIAVYKAITQYSWVDRKECFAQLGIPKKAKAQDIPRPLCPPDEFRIKIRGKNSSYRNLIKKNMIENGRYGIPQGSPISSTLSNIYMIPFDVKMKQLINELGGVYMRYSDDILFVCDLSSVDLIQARVNEEMYLVGNRLEINASKTLISRFSTDENGSKTVDKPFQYLGFTFDGIKTLIRPQTLSRFWRSVIYKIRKAKKSSLKAASKSGIEQKPFKRKIYRQYTHLGKRNFLSYSERAYRLMNDPAIKKQLKRHWDRIQAELAKPL